MHLCVLGVFPTDSSEAALCLLMPLEQVVTLTVDSLFGVR